MLAEQPWWLAGAGRIAESNRPSPGRKILRMEAAELRTDTKSPKACNRAGRPVTRCSWAMKAQGWWSRWDRA